MGGSNTTSFYAQRIVVGVGDLSISNNVNVILSTYALGSCVGIAAYEPNLNIGGLLHLMLPDSRLSPDKATAQPSIFADTGITTFLSSLEGLGAEISNLNFFLAGGASNMTSNASNDVFKIGDRNISATKRILNEVQAKIVDEDLGGFNNRTVHLRLETGIIEVRMPSGTKIITLNDNDN